MLENSVSFTRLSAGSGIDSVESRVKQLEAMINAVDKRQTTPTQLPATLGRPTFKTYLKETAIPPKIQPVTPELQQRSEAIQPLVQKYAAEYGIDTSLINAVIRQESGFNPNAVSKVG